MSEIQRLRLDELAAHLKTSRLPPVEQWQPENCGDSEIRIARDGSWHHQNTPIQRQALIKLFARVLRREADEYFLVTPAEKLKVQVEDVPFIAIDLEIFGQGAQQKLLFTTNCDDQVIADQEHLLYSRKSAGQPTPAPYLMVRNQLAARLAYPVYYQIAELVETVNDQYGVWSGGYFHVLHEQT